MVTKWNLRISSLKCIFFSCRTSGFASDESSMDESIFLVSWKLSIIFAEFCFGDFFVLKNWWNISTFSDVSQRCFKFCCCNTNIQFKKFLSYLSWVWISTIDEEVLSLTVCLLPLYSGSLSFLWPDSCEESNLSRSLMKIKISN